MEPSIEVVRGGPMIVRGGITLARIEREAPEPGWRLAPHLDAGEEYALCRCGRSSTMPMCDRVAPYGCFEEESPTRGLEKRPVWDVPDPSSSIVALKPNGPIRVAGTVRMTDPSGRQVPDHLGRRSICRCGVSRSQPLCDGSHKLVPPYEDPSPEDA